MCSETLGSLWLTMGKQHESVLGWAVGGLRQPSYATANNWLVAATRMVAAARILTSNTVMQVP